MNAHARPTPGRNDRRHPAVDVTASVAPLAADPEAYGLQALAAGRAGLIEAERPESGDPAERRGPFRPGQLVSARVRRSGAEAVRWFRAIDVAALTGLAVAILGAPGTVSFGDVRMRDATPFAVALMFVLWLTRSAGLYRFGRSERLKTHLARLVAVIVGAAAVSAVVAAVLASTPAALTGLIVWAALSGLVLHGLHICWWLTVARWRRSGRLTPNVVVVGATRHAEALIRSALQRRDVNVLGVFDDRLARSPGALEGVPVLGDTASLLQHRIMPYVDRVVVAVDPSARARVRQLIERLRVLPQEVSLVVDVDTASARDAALTRLADAPLTRISGVAEDEGRAFAKRLQDLIIGCAALVMLSPVLALIAIAVRLDSSGPVFFRQKRHGFNSETITVWKFRTMRDDRSFAGGERQVAADDDRVTRLGRILRSTSLDELPQLINVVLGEMSLVGPRPHPVAMKTGDVESARLVAEYAWRNRMKPGMTGWAAINGSRGPLHTPAEVRRRVALDVDYIERQSFWFDLYIMAMTIPCLLGDRMAVR